jgi:hypothetical protein
MIDGSQMQTTRCDNLPPAHSNEISGNREMLPPFLHHFTSSSFFIPYMDLIAPAPTIVALLPEERSISPRKWVTTNFLPVTGL